MEKVNKKPAATAAPLGEAKKEIKAPKVKKQPWEGVRKIVLDLDGNEIIKPPKVKKIKKPNQEKQPLSEEKMKKRD